MDRDFALALVESENRIMSNSTTSVSDLPHDLGRHGLVVDADRGEFPHPNLFQMILISLLSSHDK